GYTSKNISFTIVSRSFVHFAPPSVVNSHVVIWKLVNVIDNEVIVYSITIRCNPLINYHIARIKKFFFDFTQSKNSKTFYFYRRCYCLVTRIYYSAFVNPKVLIGVPTYNV